MEEIKTTYQGFAEIARIIREGKLGQLHIGDTISTRHTLPDRCGRRPMLLVASQPVPVGRLQRPYRRPFRGAVQQHRDARQRTGGGLRYRRSAHQRR